LSTHRDDPERLASLPDAALDVRLARKAAGLTLKAVGERLGCSAQYICHIEAGRARPSRVQIERVLDAIREAGADR